MVLTVNVSLTDVKVEGGRERLTLLTLKGREREKEREREREKEKQRGSIQLYTTHLLYQSHISSPCPDATTHRSTDRGVCQILHSKSPATKQTSASINVVLYFT